MAIRGDGHLLFGQKRFHLKSEKWKICQIKAEDMEPFVQRACCRETAQLIIETAVGVIMMQQYSTGCVGMK